MEWRPEEGWENPEDEECYAYETYEAGADAMLRALKAKFPHIICLGIRGDKADVPQDGRMLWYEGELYGGMGGKG